MSWKKKDARKLIEGVYSGEFTETRLPRHLFQFTSKQLFEAFEDGWRRHLLTDPDIQAPDLRLAQSFKRNIWYFSANKTAKQQSALQALLFDDNGNKRPLHKFTEEALKVDKTFNARFLEAEYNTTFRLAESGREWQDIEATKDSFPFLEFVAVMDDNTRHSHAERDGIIRRVDDPWWLQNMPPLDWNCRCRTRQHAVANETPLESRDVPEPPPLFRHNVFKSRQVWKNDEHPYSDLSAKQKEAASSLVREAIASAPLMTVAVYKKGSVKLSPFHGLNELEDNLATAKILAKNGHHVKLLPNHEGRRSADAKVNGRVMEFKTTERAVNGIRNGVKEAGKQGASVAVIHIKGAQDAERIIRAVQGAFGKNPKTGEPMNRNIAEVWIIHNGKVLKTGRFVTETFRKKVRKLFKDTEGAQ
jgi:SPP1 gp7 family putative phage head morphogenesis protein